MKITDIYWLAGLLEGEGSFCLITARPRRGEKLYHYRYPAIGMGSTDKDVLCRAAKMLGVTGRFSKAHGSNSTFKSKKPMYQLRVNGRRAVAWMLTLYSLLGNRRRSQIRSTVSWWQKGCKVT